MTKFGYICVAGVTLNLLTSAWAQDQAGMEHRKPVHQGLRADQNGDGLISYDEAVENLPGMTELRFQRMDADGDGQLAAEELQRRERAEHYEQQGRERFNIGDTDKDGKLNAEELKAFAPRFPASRFSEVDVDADGGLSYEELANARRQRGQGEGDHRAERDMIGRLDGDGDGQISIEEFRAVRPEMSEERYRQLDADSSGGVTREEFRAARARSGGGSRSEDREAMINKMFDERDADNSGGLTRDEFVSPRGEIPASRFERMDADGDGAVSREELLNTVGDRGPARDGEGHRHPADLPEN